MGQEIRSSTLLELKVPLLPDISPIPAKVVKNQRHRVATKNEADIDNSQKDGAVAAEGQPALSL